MKGLGLAPTSGWVTLQQALIFIDPLHLDVVRDVGEILSDADGFVRTSSGSAAAGPEFPHAVFDSKFRGLHLDRGNPDETIQYARNTRECIRRWVVEGRSNRAQLASASLAVVPGPAPWLLLEYALSGDGFSVQVATEDEGLWSLRQAIPLIPDDPRIYGAPTFSGQHRLRLDGEPAGKRVATLTFYDETGVLAEVGPIHIDVPAAQGAPEPAPVTSLVAIQKGAVEVTSNGRGAEFAHRLVSVKGDATPWSAWSASTTIPVAALSAGTYELTIVSRHADNQAGELVEELDPLTVGVRVDGAGTITLRR